MMTDTRLAFIGYGAMARSLARRLSSSDTPLRVGAALVERRGDAPADTVEVLSLADLIAWRPTLVAECAGHGAVKHVVPSLLEAGIDVVTASVGALSDRGLRERLTNASLAGGGRLILPSGAVGGLDALRAAKNAGLNRVNYIGRKPPLAWGGTPADEQFDLRQLREPTTIFDGPAGEAARLYPKNANVTAAVALAGLGFEATTVRLVADPTTERNVHEIDASGAFGELFVRLCNVPLPENPKTSMLAALSLEFEIRRETRSLSL